MALPGHHLLQQLAYHAGVPAGVHLQIADRCNHACRHCYQVQGRKGEMTTEEIKALLDDLASAGVMLLNVSGGEATLRSDLLEILRYARSKGFAIRLFTNGYTMTPEVVHQLQWIGLLGVDISVYSDEPAQHDAITRVPGSHAKTIAGVRALIDGGIRVHLKVPTTSLVPDAAERIQRLAATLGPSVSVVASHDITPMENGDLKTCALTPSPDVLVQKGVLQPWQPPHDLENTIEQTRKEPTCGACRDGVAVMSNGDLRPCTDIVAPLGNLRTKRFLELYQTQEAGMVRGLTWNDIHGCRDCHLMPACERCHASASHEAGDLLGPYPSACASAVARYRAAVGTLTFADPKPGCEQDRNPTNGPFEIVSHGVLRASPDVLKEHDRQYRVRFPWVCPTREFLEDMSYGEQQAGSPADSFPRRLPLLTT